MHIQEFVILGYLFWELWPFDNSDIEIKGFLKNSSLIIAICISFVYMKMSILTFESFLVFSRLQTFLW